MGVPTMEWREFIRTFGLVTGLAASVGLVFWGTAGFFVTDSIGNLLAISVFGSAVTGLTVGVIYAVTALVMTALWFDKIDSRS